MTPTVSVISGIYNCAETLPEAIESILAQTFTDWEWILCDDASGDNTYAVAKEYADKYPDKFVLLKNEKNKGLNYTLNRCLEKAKGRYIARMDGDDLCSPERFEEEFRCLEENPDIAIVSTDMDCFDQTGIWGKISHPENPQPKDFLIRSPFCHAPCMVRKEAYMAVGGYSVEKRLLRVEDYHLWVKMYAAGFRGRNIHRSLYRVREDRDTYSRRRFRYRINEAYVRLLTVKKLKLPLYTAVYALRPIIVGLIPKKLYDFLHKRNLRR